MKYEKMKYWLYQEDVYEELKNKKFQYRFSRYSLEIERMVTRLENLFEELLDKKMRIHFFITIQPELIKEYRRIRK